MKKETYEEFIKSAYYTAFVKFGNYCVDISALNIPRLVEYYLKENVKILNKIKISRFANSEIFTMCSA